MRRLTLCVVAICMIWVCNIISAQDRGYATSIAWSPDGETIAVGSSTGVWFFDTEFNELGYVEVDLEYGPTVNERLWTSPNSLEWNAAGNLLAVGFPVIGNGVSDIQIVDFNRLEVITKIDMSDWREPLWSQVVWHPTDNVVAAGGFWSKTLIWDALTGEELFEFEESNKQTAFPWNSTEAVCWFAESVIAIITEWEIYVVDVEVNKTLQSLDFGFPMVHGAYCNSEYKILSRGGELIDLNVGTHVNIFDQINRSLKDGIFPFSLELGPSPLVLEAEFSPDGSKILSIAEGCLIHVSDGQNGRLLAEIPGGMYIVRGAYISFLDSLSWHPDGSRFAAVGQFGGISVWDAETYELLRRFDGFNTSYPATSLMSPKWFNKETLDWIDALKMECIESLNSEPYQK